MPRRICVLAVFFFSAAVAAPQGETIYWIKARARDKYERSRIANLGVAIETIEPDFVIALGDGAQLKELQSQQVVSEYREQSAVLMDFPSYDSKYRDYSQVRAQIRRWEHQFPDIVRVHRLGRTHEGRDILDVLISGTPDHVEEKPGIVFLGGHHGREHLSVEMPLGLIEHLLSRYKAGHKPTIRLIQNRAIHVVPMVNPDGLEHDIAGNRYHMWRKNRRKNPNGTFGVDLNRNYGHEWLKTGASQSPSSEVYGGPEAFSEPETQAIKKLIDYQPNISILLSFHTFSKLILYPWGHTFESIGVSYDKSVHQTMAQKMARWNGYRPQQSSDLYTSSGDTTDWAYGAHRIISFTFELDPASMKDGGFYPRHELIEKVIKKNIKPSLYLIDHADNPYRVLEPKRPHTVDVSGLGD